MEEVLTFENRNGEKLYGIVHIPEKEIIKGKRIGINLLNPGIKYRVAPHRLNVKLARRLCKQGFYVLRFDPAGIGDSEGELPEGTLITEIWAKIQTGLFVPDTIAANDIFINKFQIQHLIMMGSCGGAITALLAAEKNMSIAALCLIDVPVFLGSANINFSDIVVEGGVRAEWLFGEYIKRMLSPRHWYRFVTLQTDYRALWRIMNMKLREKLLGASARSPLPEKVRDLCNQKKLNPMFFECLHKFLEHKKPALFLLAEKDHGTELFQNFVQDSFLPEFFKRSGDSNLVEVFMVPSANHIYTLIESQENMMNKVCEWVSNINARG